MNDPTQIEKQIQREMLAKERAEQKLQKDIRKNEAAVNASNTVYGVPIMREYLGAMIAEMTRQKELVLAGKSGFKTAERFEILERCLGVVFKRNKGSKNVEHKDFFDPELACHIAFQMCLDAVMLPDRPEPKSSRQSTKLFDGLRPTMRMLQDEIARQLHRQMLYRVMDANFGNWFHKTHKKAMGDTSAKSSPFYTLNSLDWYVNNFKEYCQNDERAEVFEFHSWTYAEREVIGSWLLTLVKQTGLFTQVPSKRNSREKTLAVSKTGQEIVDELVQQSMAVACQPLPMIVPPAEMTRERLGGWLSDAAVLNTPTNSSWKGRIELSDLHLEFYNNAQKQAFKINPFTWEIVKTLRERNEQLGKFKAYTPQPLIPMWKEMEIHEMDWMRCSDKSEQDALIRRDRNKFKSVCRARSKRYNDEQAKKIDGQPSQYLYDMVEDCINEERLYIPIEPDFRSRFTCRTSYLSYQGNDCARGLLMFADEYPIDNETKRFLSIHLANQAGLDKESYSTRIEWVESNLDVIETVAVMNDGDISDFQNGIGYIREFADEEFQFAAACREYYELFIARSKTTTSLPCAIDATCSGQQLIAGFLRSGELAARVNVLPTTKPGDIYKDTMDKMLELAADDEQASFTRKTLKALKGSIGRKMSKKGFMSGQYGSGTERQLTDMFAFIDEDTDLKLNEVETLLIRKYWSEALEEICKIRVVFNWFRSLVEELHDLGKTEVIIPTPTGSRIHQRYPIPKLHSIRTFSFGSSDYKVSETEEMRSTNRADLGKWKTATAANTIHGAGDASLLCMALHDFEHPFYCVHDSIACPATSAMKQLQERLRAAYKQVVTFDLWNEVRRANGLPTGETYLPALCNDLDLDLIDKSEYLFC